ncbi:hypothetical protein [Amycolatopsis sp. NPDC051372]|uniref:hypothetical protein n=1 Tax=unclassified Amycolatopsis TaxID=2618356 RepID=UPI003444EF50
MTGAGPKDSAADVAEAGIAALMAGDDTIVAGAKNKVMAAGSRMLPDEVKAAQRGR